MIINRNREGSIKTLKVPFIDGKPSKPEEIHPVKELKTTDLIMKVTCNALFAFI